MGSLLILEIPRGIERVFMKKFISGIFLVVFLYCAGLLTQIAGYANEPAWNEIWDPNMVDLVGSDGTKYYTSKDYWIMYYHQDGSTTFKQTEGGALQKRLRIACYDGTIQTVYCIGAGLTYQYGGDKYQKEDLNIPNDYYARLPEAARQGIDLALLFGYEDGISSPVPGTNEDDYWMATQAIIWEYQQGLRVGAEDLRDNGPVARDVYFQMIHNRPAEFCYDWIVNHIRQYLIFPSFLTTDSILYKDNYVAVQQEKDGLYTLDLYDDNHTESPLEVIDDRGGIPDWVEIIHLNGSNYRLQITKPVQEPVTFRVQKVVPQGHKSLLYFSDGSGATQVVICRSTQSSVAKDLRPFTVSTRDYVERGNIHITKSAEQGNLDYVFRIQGLEIGNAHICETVHTNQEGQAVLEAIPAGTYEIQELLPADSPWKQPAPQRVVVTDKMTAEVTFHNVLKRGSLTIHKTFEGRNTPWQGIQFEVTGTYQGETVYQETVSADTMGYCVLKDLPVGQYEIREMPVGQEAFYEICPPVTAIISENQTAEVELYNPARKTQIQIEKTGEVITSFEQEGAILSVTRQEPLTTAVFEIYAEEDICAEDGTLRVSKGTLVDTVSWQDGKYQSCMLYPGVYRIRESLCPEGYVPCEDRVVSLNLHEETTICIENYLLPKNPKTGEAYASGTKLGVMGIAVCVLGIIAFYRKSRYNN